MIAAQWLGRLEYRWAWRLQHLRREAVEEGTAPEVVWLLEHDPVVTLGRRRADVDVDALAARGTPVVATERGGLATWHGPGQLTGYVLVHLGRRSWQIRKVVAGLEDGLRHAVATWGIDAHRREGAPGLWVGSDKLAAIGLHVRRDVSMHGFALNLDPDLSAFSGFVPCGIADGGVTSVRRLTGATLRPHEVADHVGRSVISALFAAHGADPR